MKDLPAIVSAMLVKPIPPALDASGEGLFTTVIPDNRCMSCGVPEREQAAAQHGYSAHRLQADKESQLHIDNTARARLLVLKLPVNYAARAR